MNTNRPTGNPTRREVLGYSAGAAFAAAAIAGCDTSPAGEDGEQGAGGAEKGLEAPMLTEQVDAGDLPPVEERLPENPLVVEPADRVGTYGGTWRTATLGTSDTPWLGRTMGYEGLMRWNPDGVGASPNIAESIDVSEDGSEFTIHLRAGMKWSDGEPFTADDILFAYQDVFSNEELNPVFPSDYTSLGEPLTMEKVDDVTVLVRFPEPAGLFLERLAFGNDWVVHPRHYLEQFHAEYNPDVDALVEEEGFAEWVELFGAKADPWNSVDLPRLFPWVIKNALGEAERLVCERNPYYFKVDPDGSQLPYIDEIIYDVITDAQVILLKGSNGELDFHTRHINTLPNKPVLAETREANGYDFTDIFNTLSTDMVISLNLVHSDANLREVFQNREFRIGLSHAINRGEMIDTVFQRQGEPHQPAPVAESEYYDEEYAKQYTEYDPDLANDFLDQAGYAERDADGFRLGPDGKRIAFTVQVASPALIPFWVDAMELVVSYWEEVGVRAQVQSIDRSLFYERKDANDYDANVWTGDGGWGGEIHEARWYFPFTGESNYAIPWAAWFRAFGEGDEEPVEPARQQMDLFRQMEATADEEERRELFREILAIAKEEFWCIGTVRIPDIYSIKRNDFHNVPASFPEAHYFATPALTNPEQYFIEG